jgi:hypothetical protein
VRKEASSDLLSRYEADDERFLSRFVTGMKHGYITLNRRPKDRQWSGIIQLLLGGRSLRLPLQQRKSWPLFFWDAEGVILVDIMPRGQTINSDLYTQTLKNLQKRLRRVRSHKNIAEILLQHDNA